MFHQKAVKSLRGKRGNKENLPRHKKEFKIEEDDPLLKLREGGDTQDLGHLLEKIAKRRIGIREIGLMIQEIKEEGVD